MEVKHYVPSLGERVPDYIKITSLTVKTGEKVEKGQKLGSIETDKVQVDLIAENSGVVELLVDNGDFLSVGDLYCTIKMSNDLHDKLTIKSDSIHAPRILENAKSQILFKNDFDSISNINGQHVIEYPNDHPDYPGLIFSGDFKDGKLNGYGCISMSEEFAATTVIQGEYEEDGFFIDNQLNGLGKKLDYEDQIEFGQFKNGELHGIGWINDSDYNFTKGRFINGKLVQVIKECDILNSQSRYSASSVFSSIDLDEIKLKLS